MIRLLLLAFALSSPLLAQDVTPPVILAPAQNVTLECDGTTSYVGVLNSWLSVNGAATAYDDVDGSFLVWTNDYAGGSSGGDCIFGTTVTFVAVDSSGNAASTTASFSVLDTVAPILGWALENNAITAGETILLSAKRKNFPVTLSVGASDACSVPALSATYSWTGPGAAPVVTVVNGVYTVESAAVGTTITLSAFAVDECGNASEPESVTLQVVKNVKKGA